MWAIKQSGFKFLKDIQFVLLGHINRLKPPAKSPSRDCLSSSSPLFYLGKLDPLKYHLYFHAKQHLHSHSLAPLYWDWTPSIWHVSKAWHQEEKARNFQYFGCRSTHWKHHSASHSDQQWMMRERLHKTRACVSTKWTFHGSSHTLAY